MIRKTLLVITSLIAFNCFAQNNDSSTLNPTKDTVIFSSTKDTVKVGKLVIVTKRKNGGTGTDIKISNDTLFTSSSTKDTVRIGKVIIVTKRGQNRTATNIKFAKRKQSQLISTNWWVFDLGFANLVDNTNYTTAQTQGYINNVNGAVTSNSMALRAGKTSNVNIWFFMQKLNISKHVLNLKYGLGLEMYNFRYEHSLSYRNDSYPYIFNDTVGFSKNKLYAGYLTVPLMINFKPIPSKRNSFSMSLGVSAGYLVGDHQKQVSDARGKQKFHGDFDLNPWRFATIGEIGLGPVRLYGSYSLNGLYKKSTGLDQTPYAVGIRFSNW